MSVRCIFQDHLLSSCHQSLCWCLTEYNIVDVLSIGSIQTSAAHAVNSRAQGQPSRLSLSILSRSGESILDLDAIHGAQKAEWVDGLGMLLGKEQLGTVESEEYVKILTELGIKIRLLDIGGDGIEIPDKLDFARGMFLSTGSGDAGICYR